MASPSQAQLEPEAFTILKVAVQKKTPSAGGILSAMNSWKTKSDREKLADVWLKVWGNDTAAFDAFGGCFLGGEKAKASARRLIKTRNRTLTEKEVARAATGLLDQLNALPAADRQRLEKFIRLARSRIDKR
jgi:hypothetical protein